MRKIKLFFVIVILAAGLSCVANDSEIQEINYTHQSSVITVPAGRTFKSVTTMPLSSAVLTAGQNVTLALSTDFYYNVSLIAPAGSSVTGTVIEVNKAKHGTLNGKLLLRFSQIITPAGAQIPISAVIKTDDNTGVLLGAQEAAMPSPPANTMRTIPVDAGSGLVKSIWEKGNDVEIPANTPLELVLTQPITMNPAIYKHDY
jgi:hypothetical protein